MNELKSRSITLHPGDFSFGTPGTKINTILGSCVAITLWHPQHKIGAMCHFVHPHRPFDVMLDIKNIDGKYAKCAFELFELGAKLHNISLNEFQGKVFGGADVAGTGNNDTIGQKNITQAMGWIASNKIQLISAHVGESGARKIVFDISNGDVLVSHTPALKFQGVSGKS